MNVLTFNGVYKPGYKAGGPIKSISNMASALKDDFNFLVVASDRDFGDNEAYKDIVVNQWNTVDNEKVFYHEGEYMSIINFYQLLNNTTFDIAYLNGYYSNYTRKFLILNRLGLIKKQPIIICPRGDFTEGNSNSFLKKLKKRVYIELLKIFGLNKNVIWHATSSQEAKDIRNTIGQNIDVYTIPNISIGSGKTEIKVNKEKSQGSVNLVFLSRISRKKNLLAGIKSLKDITGKVNLNIYGPVFDEDYWEICKKEIKKLPSNVVVNYMGSIENTKVYDVFKSHHFFLFPTFGENYGHVIIESLISGCPVILSDQTPWRNLEKENVGWDIDLSDTKKFKQMIQYCVDMDQIEYQKMSNMAAIFGKANIADDDNIKNFKDFFMSLNKSKGGYL